MQVSSSQDTFVVSFTHVVLPHKGITKACHYHKGDAVFMVYCVSDGHLLL